jgi:glyoxylase-like metal-dependent hydrolase (beta-lactamase superfamily II)
MYSRPIEADRKKIMTDHLEKNRLDTKPLQVGDLEIIPIHDGIFSIPTPPQLKGEDDPEFEIHRSYVPGDGRFYSQLGAFLVRTGDRIVLLDAGLGPACGHCGTYCGEHAPEAELQKFDQQWRNFGRDEDFVKMRRRGLRDTVIRHGELENSLMAAGVRPDQVTDVVLSHLHCDHMGWCSKEGRAFFSNADLWVHEADAEWFLGDREYDETATRVMFGVGGTKERMAPALGQIRTWTKDMTIAPGIDVRHTPGHTPGSSIAIVSSNGERAMMLGDTIHCPLEMTDEDFSIMADTDPKLAHQTKLALLREVEDGSVHVASTHFPGMRFGRVLKSHEANKRHFSWS